VDAQGGPGDLRRTRGQDHDEIAGAEAEDQAADHLLGALASLEGGLLERRNGPRVAEDSMPDAELLEGDGYGAGRKGSVWGGMGKDGNPLYKSSGAQKDSPE
jgi:hypothetical protein